MRKPEEIREELERAITQRESFIALQALPAWKTYIACIREQITARSNQISRGIRTLDGAFDAAYMTGEQAGFQTAAGLIEGRLMALEDEIRRLKMEMAENERATSDSGSETGITAP